jgi:membrane fusion protein (multidrug efflux system)
VVVKRYRNLGDFASAGASLLSLYNSDQLYVEANLEETRLPGVAPGNAVRIEIDAFPQPFRRQLLPRTAAGSWLPWRSSSSWPRSIRRWC